MFFFARCRSRCRARSSSRAGRRGCFRPAPCGCCRGSTVPDAGSWDPSDGWRVAEGEDALLRPALLFVAPRAAERRVETCTCPAPALQRLGLHDVGVDGRAMRERGDACGLAVLRLMWTMRLERSALAIWSRNGDHLAGTSRSCRRAGTGTAGGRARRPSSPGAAGPRSPCRWNTACTGLCEPGGDLAQDEDALRLEPGQM